MILLIPCLHLCISEPRQQQRGQLGAYEYGLSPSIFLITVRSKAIFVEWSVRILRVSKIVRLEPSSKQCFNYLGMCL